MKLDKKISHFHQYYTKLLFIDTEAKTQKLKNGPLKKYTFISDLLLSLHILLSIIFHTLCRNNSYNVIQIRSDHLNSSISSSEFCPI